MFQMDRQQALEFFSRYMRITGVPRLGPLPAGEAALLGKTLGIVNGSSWIELWVNYFGRLILPGVKFVNVGNEAVQLNFMQAHRDGKPCPPARNIEVFAEYSRELVELANVDAVLISCSTMNRSFDAVRSALASSGVPVVQIDIPMMEKAVLNGGKVLVVATHGPTVKSTQALLRETAQRLKRTVEFTGVTVEDAFELLGEGKIQEHNDVIAQAIRDSTEKEAVSIAVLAQLSMAVFKLSYPDPEAAFGIPVLTSAEEGFRRIRDIFLKACGQTAKEYGRY